MSKIKEITYPITVYLVSNSNCFPFDDGELRPVTFESSPANMDAHFIKDGKFIWRRDYDDHWQDTEYYLDKGQAKKVALEFTKKRLKEYQEKVIKLKKQLKEIRAL